MLIKETLIIWTKQNLKFADFHQKFFHFSVKVTLLSGSDTFKGAILFGLAFETTPTYEELKNGTPKLSPLFELNKKFNKGEKPLSGVDGTRTRDLSRDRRTL